MAEAKAGGQRVHPLNLVLAPLLDVVYDFHNPVVVDVADRRVAVARHLVVEVRHGRGDGVRVEVAGGRGMVETDDVAVGQVANRLVGVVGRLLPVGEDKPVVVLVLVVVASDLLLARAYWVCLDMRMQETTAPAHVLERDPRAERDF